MNKFRHYYKKYLKNKNKFSKGEEIVSLFLRILSIISMLL